MGNYRVDVDYTIFHPSYNERTHIADVALVRMSKPILEKAGHLESYASSSAADLFNRIKEMHFRTVFWNFGSENQTKEYRPYNSNYQKLYYQSEECPPRQNSK